MLSKARSFPCFQLVFDVATFESSIGSVKLDLEYSKYSRSNLTEPIDNSKVATSKTSWKHGRLRLLDLILPPPPFSFARRHAGTSRYKMCGGTSVYAANSTYRSNLNLMLSSLLADASRGFYAGVAGQPPTRSPAAPSAAATSTPPPAAPASRRRRRRPRPLPYDKDAVVW
uniref:Uncharacterized protein n=1 Tax=Ananas comosus var. bracteatus TaxID=296719 RepID=A0A6V7PEM1_ANACO|nr:unnamed protein product [Ananas comosus var. bracteatus]